MTTQLPRLFTTFNLVDPNDNASATFVSFWNNFASTLETTVNTLQTQVAQATQAAAAAQAAAAQANQALSIADAGGGVPGAVSGSTTTTNLNVQAYWTDGPLVPLTGVSAGNLTVSLSFTGSVESPNPYGYNTGNYRIQEIVSGVETTVFTGNFVLGTTYLQNVQLYILSPSDLSVAQWSALNLARTSTGAISYRLDFQLASGTYPLKTIYLYVRRS